jgi:uncharacterized protein (TIGR02246 family)
MTRSMTKIRVLLPAAIAAMVFFSLALVGSRHAFASGGDSAAIKHVIEGFTADFNRHDSHAVSVWFTEDADFINVQQADSQGRKNIEDHFVPLFSGRLKNAHRTISVKSIRFVTPDVAVADVDYELTGAINVNGTADPLRKGLYDWVLVKQNGKWLISAFHESEVAAPAK